MASICLCLSATSLIFLIQKHENPDASLNRHSLIDMGDR